jgi:peptide/nickel transport system substrate-binding protein
MNEPVPNERLRRARSLKGWSQADLAAKIGSSFEMVSRWERGVTLPSPYYRERLSAVLGKRAEELGLTGAPGAPIATPQTPIALLVSSHADAANPLISSLAILLQEREITLISSGQLSRRGREHTHAALRETLRSARAILVILSPEARASRHVRQALELARLYPRLVYGLWIAGESWQACIPEESADLIIPIDARTNAAPALIVELAAALEHAGAPASESGALSATGPVASTPQPAPAPERTDSATPRLGALARFTPFVSRIRGWPGKTRNNALVLRSLAALVIISAVLAGSSVARGNSSVQVDRGGVWKEDIQDSPSSLIPNAGDPSGALIDQALYLPLFYGDANGVIHPGAATETPTLRNGGVSPDGATWTFHLRPHLVWSDGSPYDARDVDYTWKLWLDPAFGAPYPNGVGLSLIRSAEVSTDHLTITFRLKQAYAPFLQYWVDGYLAPLPAHHFSAMAAGAIQQSADNLDPIVTSGPFMMAESAPGDHFTLVRNPRYYLASQGLPYLDKVIFRVASEDTILNDLQSGAITATSGLDLGDLPVYQRLTGYQLIHAPTSGSFEALWFNFHNTILASHLEVRQAMAMAIDRQALVTLARRGFGSPLCTDHPSAIHPSSGPATLKDCPEYDLAAANRLLDDSGWVKGGDGVRAKGGQRLEFEYSTTTNTFWRDDTQTIIQRDFTAIGVKLDIQNYPAHAFFGLLLSGGEASPPSGAVAGRFDIAEYAQNFSYDPDDSYLLACDQAPPQGGNLTSYCNPTLDALYQQELTTVEPGRRQQIFGFIDNVYVTDLPLIILYSWSPTDPAIARVGTHNYLPSPIAGSTVNIWSWWCDQGRC